MKKIITSTLVITVLLIGLVGCGTSKQEDTVIGKWKVMEITFPEIEATKKPDEHQEYHLDLQKNGKGYWYNNESKDNPSEIEWQVNDDGEIKIALVAGNSTQRLFSKAKINDFGELETTIILSSGTCIEKWEKE